jgi:putative DNA primase/helicase
MRAEDGRCVLTKAPMMMPPHLILINALEGDENTGMCCCPAHDDEQASLSVGVGHKQPVILYCHAGCSFESITSKLRAMGLWPVQGSSSAAPVTSQRRTYRERKQYARSILEAVRQNRGRELAHLLKDYFVARGLDVVPATALLALPWCYSDDVLCLPTEPAMVFPVTNGRRNVGVHVTWLKADLSAKRDAEPQRQFFGPVKGGYIKLYEGEHDPGRPLIIAEGVETALSAAQRTRYPAIAALSAKNMPEIKPPPASEYIIAADNDANGNGQQAARALAAKLVRGGAVVRVAIPPKPDTDWNDEILNSMSN